MGNSPSPWRGSTGIPKPFLFPLFSFDPHPPILPEVSDPPWHDERLLASESRCAEQETTFGPDDRKREGAATDPPPPPQSPQETVLYSWHRVQRPAHSPLPQTVAPWWVFFPFFSFLRLQSCYETCGSTRKEQTWACCRGAEGNIRRSIYSKRHFNNSTFSSFLVWHGTNENAIASCCLVLAKR